jgi:iron complex transport system substrate-binding protein
MLGPLLKRSRIPLNTPVVLPDATLAEEYIGKIHHELKNSGSQDEEIVKAYMTLFVKMLERQLFPEQQSSPYSGTVLRAMRFMEEHRCHPLQLAEIARAVNLSIPRFSVRFRQETGKSPMAYLLEDRLNYARTLFYDRNLTIGEIALRSGFNDPLYFSRQFHRRFGMSPSKFRENLLAALSHSPEVITPQISKN